ncbi:MAG: phage terminase large subunit, partial [Bacteroidota bacterium]
MTIPLGRTTVLFEANYSNRTHRVKNNQGGTGSGKTYAILQVICTRLIEKKGICTVVGSDMPNLRRGAFRDLEDRILPAWPELRRYTGKPNKSTCTYRFTNGSILEFTSYENEQDAKSGKRDIAFFNEANGISHDIYKQVAMRTNEEIFIDYNASAPFWAHDHLHGQPNVATYISNWTHNPFISEGTLLELGEIKEKDDELWQVYGLGKTGNIGDLCIENITVVPEMPKNLKRQGFGIDFGYRADPTTLVHGGIQNEKDLYFDLLLYRRGLKLGPMVQAFKEINVHPGTPYFADGADGRACDYLKDSGYNLREVRKGAGSIAYGLELLNQYNIHITERSIEMLEEQKKYAYKKHKRGDRVGQLTNEPIDAYNHCWDGARY